jgi:hypothetical protein
LVTDDLKEKVKKKGGGNLASSDCHLLLHLKKFLVVRSLRSDQETKDVQDWLKGLMATFFDKGIQKLVS